MTGTGYVIGSIVISFCFVLIPVQEQPIVRPREIYLGEGPRDYVPIGARISGAKHTIASGESSESRRRNAAY